MSQLKCPDSYDWYSVLLVLCRLGMQIKLTTSTLSGYVAVVKDSTTVARLLCCLADSRSDSRLSTASQLHRPHTHHL